MTPINDTPKTAEEIKASQIRSKAEEMAADYKAELILRGISEMRADSARYDHEKCSLAMADYLQKAGEWMDVNERVPKIKQDVLCYYTIKKDKKHIKEGEKEYHEYFEIGYLDSITDGGDYKQYSWNDKEYNAINPSHWMPLPSPPTNTEI